jgi:myo-inositol-1(or 4)-monophosphatase
LLSETELIELEAAAVEIARGAGAILLAYFEGPLKVDYKSANNRNPVTDADHAADAYLNAEIINRFPRHGIVSEESDPADESETDIVWVIDPLDGTSNFLNGIPLFGVLIAVLEQGKPVVGAIWIPDIFNPLGRVLHAHAGGGAFDEEDPLHLALQLDGKRRMSTWPSYFLRMFTFDKSLNRKLGDVRALGSAGFELAQAARGVLDYVVYNGLWAWDLSAGLLLIQEAGGIAFQFDKPTKTWSPFQRISPDSSNRFPTRGEINNWHGTLVLGRRDSVEFISAGIGLPAFRWRRLKNRVKKLAKRG